MLVHIGAHGGTYIEHNGAQLCYIVVQNETHEVTQVHTLPLRSHRSLYIMVHMVHNGAHIVHMVQYGAKLWYIVVQNGTHKGTDYSSHRHMAQ